MGTEDTRQSVFDEGGLSGTPRTGRKKRWLLAGAMLIVVIAAMLVPVLVLEGLQKKSKYPGHSRLNYGLIDTCVLSSGLNARQHYGLTCHDRLGHILLREVHLFP